MAPSPRALLGRTALPSGEGHRSKRFSFDSPAAGLALALGAAGSSLGLSLALQAPASAVALADNILETTRSGLLVGYSLGNLNYEGMKFNTTSASVVNEVVVKLQQSTGLSVATQGSVFFDIYSDNAGLPGSVVASSIGSVDARLIPADQTYYSFNSLAVALSPNSPYYLVARPDNFAARTYILWNYTQSEAGFGYAPPVRVRGISQSSAPPSFSTFTDNSLQLRIQAADVPGPLPVLGAAAAFGWSRRLRRRIGSGSAVKGSSGSHSA